MKKVFLRISQYSQKNTCLEVSLVKNIYCEEHMPTAAFEEPSKLIYFENQLIYFLLWKYLSYALTKDKVLQGSLLMITFAYSMQIGKQKVEKGIIESKTILAKVSFSRFLASFSEASFTFPLLLLVFSRFLQSIFHVSAKCSHQVSL